mmetsp:Transcript_79578/g.132885  ORF Transcript_79578/g.132885 Transcript_79578/m.132885 type:complete len:109 (+) Transcript_79578:417-743(+)
MVRLQAQEFSRVCGVWFGLESHKWYRDSVHHPPQVPMNRVTQHEQAILGMRLSNNIGWCCMPTPLGCVAAVLGCVWWSLRVPAGATVQEVCMPPCALFFLFLSLNKFK